MPIHDWTKVDAGLFHHFHQSWIVRLCDALNDNVLPPNYFALVEQPIGGPIPDVLLLELTPGKDDNDSTGESGGLLVTTAPPRAKLIRQSEADVYLKKASHIKIHRHGNVVSIVEIVSPGNKGSKSELRAFIEKTVALIRQGVHVLVVDLLPPTKRDPQGIHKAIWDEFEELDIELPANNSLTLASYDAGTRTAYVNFVAAGDVLPEVPLFYKPDRYVQAPLEASYQATWQRFPAPLKKLLEGK